MNTFVVFVNVAMVVMTVVVILYARATVLESRRATEAMRETVTALGKLLEAVQASTQASEAAVDAARETVEVARSAREADERARLERRLRDIGELVERCFDKAAAENGDRPFGGWRCVEQQFIGAALVGVGLDLPKCRALAGSSQAHAVKGDAVDARKELAEQLRKLGASAGI